MLLCLNSNLLIPIPRESIELIHGGGGLQLRRRLRASLQHGSDSRDKPRIIPIISIVHTGGKLDDNIFKKFIRPEIFLKLLTHRGSK